MRFLITGGAGYIGSHIVREFGRAGLDVVVVDDLSTGHREFVPEEVPFIEGTVLDTEQLTAALQVYEVAGVVHAAGFKHASLSVEHPERAHEQNVMGTASLLTAMRDADVGIIMFSSSAAVYGTPAGGAVSEHTPSRPESPYGKSKYAAEWLIRSAARSQRLNHTSLRYCNVVGSGGPTLYDASTHNLFPLTIEALRAGRLPHINGDDFPTPDGTCVRDYVPVADLAQAHVVAAHKLLAGKLLAPVYNLGSGRGVSVREVMTAFAEVTGIDFEPRVTPRRQGDPARIVAAGHLAARDLEWAVRHSLHEMVRSAWDATPTER